MLNLQLKATKTGTFLTDRTEDEKQETKRRWKKVLKKIGFTAPSEEYYSQMELKPKINFFRAICEADLPIEKLGVWLPDTIAMFQPNTYWIYLGEDQKLHKEHNWKIFDFLEQVLRSNHSLYDHNFVQNWGEDTDEELMPFIIHKMPGNTFQEGRKVVETWKSMKTMMHSFGLDDSCMLQRFIYPGTDRACYVRFVFHNPFAQQRPKADYGLNIINHNKIKGKDNISLTQRGTICTSVADSFDVFYIKGAEALKPYKDCSTNIVNYLERAYGYRFKMAVFDFIKDLNGKIWWIDCQAFELDLTTRPSKIPSDLNKTERQDLLNQVATEARICKVCQLPYRKREVEKIVTFSMLFELNQQLKTRGINSLNNIEKFGKSQQECTICEICYMLLVADHDLHTIGREFAAMVNIPLQVQNVKSAVLLKSGMLSSTLYQWRAFIYMDRLFDFKSHYFPSPHKLKIQLRLGDSITCMPLLTNSKPYINSPRFARKDTGIVPSFRFHTHSQSASTTIGNNSESMGLPNKSETLKKILDGSLQSIIINKCRLYYFFTERKQRIKEFLRGTEIEIRITEGVEWNNVYASAMGHPFINMNHGNVRSQRTQVEMIFFTKDSAHPMPAKLTVGVRYDDQPLTQDIKLNLRSGVYHPPENFYTVDPLPPEWIELFSKDTTDFLSTTEKERRRPRAPQTCYNPISFLNELRQLSITMNPGRSNDFLRLYELLGAGSPIMGGLGSLEGSTMNQKPKLDMNCIAEDMDYTDETMTPVPSSILGKPLQGKELTSARRPRSATLISRGGRASTLDNLFVDPNLTQKNRRGSKTPIAKLAPGEKVSFDDSPQSYKDHQKAPRFPRNSAPLGLTGSLTSTGNSQGSLKFSKLVRPNTATGTRTGSPQQSRNKQKGKLNTQNMNKVPTTLLHRGKSEYLHIRGKHGEYTMGNNEEVQIPPQTTSGISKRKEGSIQRIYCNASFKDRANLVNNLGKNKCNNRYKLRDWKGQKYLGEIESQIMLSKATGGRCSVPISPRTQWGGEKGVIPHTILHRDLCKNTRNRPFSATINKPSINPSGTQGPSTPSLSTSARPSTAGGARSNKLPVVNNTGNEDWKSTKATFDLKMYKGALVDRGKGADSTSRSSRKGGTSTDRGKKGETPPNILNAKSTEENKLD